MVHDTKYAVMIKPQQTASGEEVKIFKRSIPFVILGLDHTGKNIVIESAEENVYVKMPESKLSVPALLLVASTNSKLGAGLTPDELTLLDSKLIPVSDNKG